MSKLKGENWHRTLRQYLQSDPPAVRFELRERTQEGSSNLHSFQVPEGWEDAELWRIVGELVATAQDDTNSSETGRRSYFLLAFDAQGETLGRSQQIKFFADKNELDDTPAGGELEGANQKGLMAQLMRHTEGMVRIMQSTTQAQLAAMTQLNGQLLREKQEVEDRRLNMLVEMENLISERHKRELEEKRELSREKRLDELMGQLQRVVPALVARLLPGTSVGADATSRSLVTSIKGLVEGLPEHKYHQLMEVLGQEKGAALLELVALVQQVDEAAPAAGGSNAVAH